MRLRDAARGRPFMEAKLMLAARGIESNPRALAGAMLEAEYRIKVGAFLDGMSSSAK